ncbi:MAG: tRNA pseudouridine(55) synthase TruB [Bacteroidia bacterium]|nr:tRNA pseudouridine(55) synthase TruB [Bacteroidia bacterium]
MNDSPADTDFLAGAMLLIDKPKEWTSFDVVNKIRYAINIKKVGHAGTLDPLATGLLIICTGKFTKKLTELQGMDKEYEVIFKLGATTASYDAEQPEENLCDATHITREQVAAAMTTFLGEIDQVPPVFSAIKVNGKRAYKSARQGQEVELKSRRVSILAFELLEDDSLEANTFSARIHCTKGTYIRSLVHDLGQALGVGAYIRELRRTAIGEQRIEAAMLLSDFLAALPPRPERAKKNS